MTNTKPGRAAVTARAAVIYERISDDREGREYGVDRQDVDCKGLAERLGVPVVKVFKDNDIGASTRSKKRRPGYVAMLEYLRAGHANMVIAATSSRVTRRPREYEDLVELAEQCGITYAYVKSPSLDLNTADGRLVGRMLAANDAAESERIGERVTRARAQRATQGKFGGGSRPYGFEPDGVTLRPSEVAIVRELASRVLAGAALRMLARELNERGVPTAKGGRWVGQAVRGVLLRPCSAGIVAHHGAHVGTLPGEPILPMDQWQALVQLLGDETRTVVTVCRDGSIRRNTATVTATGRGVPRWLGSGGVYACDVCNGPLWVQQGGKYVCANGQHVKRSAARTDAYVTATVLERLRRPDLADLIPAPVPDGPDPAVLADERQAAQVRLDGLADMYADGEITDRQLTRMTARLRDRIAELDEQLRASVSVSPLAPFVGAPDVAAVWDGLALEDRRVVVKTLVRVCVLRLDRSNTPMGPDSVKLTPVSG